MTRADKEKLWRDLGMPNAPCGCCAIAAMNEPCIHDLDLALKIHKANEIRAANLLAQSDLKTRRVA